MPGGVTVQPGCYGSGGLRLRLLADSGACSLAKCNRVAAISRAQWHLANQGQRAVLFYPVPGRAGCQRVESRRTHPAPGGGATSALIRNLLLKRRS